MKKQRVLLLIHDIHMLQMHSYNYCCFLDIHHLLITHTFFPGHTYLSIAFSCACGEP